MAIHWTGPLTLAAVFALASADGYTYAGDEYSHRGRRLANWAAEIAADQERYEYSAGAARQLGPYPSNSYRFWGLVPPKGG